jgi:hypothetical protein
MPLIWRQPLVMIVAVGALTPVSPAVDASLPQDVDNR